MNARISPAKASRRYQTQMVVASVTYIALIAGTMDTLRAKPPMTERVLLALLPALPIAWMVWAVIRYLNSADELQRRVHIEALALAAGITAFLSLTYGFLEDMAGFPRAPLWTVFLVIDLVWVASGFVLWRRYK
ncbi:MAG TPA: hypothetical protein VGM16_13235 [Gammaproteobacteria bacterium]|jgi:hypothetical protein